MAPPGKSRSAMPTPPVLAIKAGTGVGVEVEVGVAVRVGVAVAVAVAVNVRREVDVGVALGPGVAVGVCVGGISGSSFVVGMTINCSAIGRCICAATASCRATTSRYAGWREVRTVTRR